MPERRRCPLCSETLDHAALGSVIVDRCGNHHGIWFDAAELATVLSASVDGAGMRLGSVTLGPSEEAALEQVHKEWLQRNAKWDSSDTAEAIGVVAAVILGLLT